MSHRITPQMAQCKSLRRNTWHI
uniref:Uncharacterized protein n=1 Tax=Anguilla anguilla TaxID=7936 RepID=A0A0E9QME2_ANGAN